ncbi:exonuclease SbcC [Pseudarthrobacter phenanthrenivorans Sphe3]|uniref:Nuclease SbcCD subunit C n=1 Tax=Pseudarthrobacter phenanthrenivorans (strain DSM 18606 / JCM 16027 / LMG 23796 / Sphe3) TaxID=930171 RepID=F0M5X0_PSEPM|nr:SMC family ATPase [Pseudarthrobacter phenanthrenivorans]ADX73565.1 exonuclease SbcC [Pseudarthrobacter phenanthrenivorans Sphe3]
MRIHRLIISGFGPFAGTEEIDFDRLSAHGLFLLNGPTGAGKTSVLDAICFALYGSVPGARQDGKRLRSDHAEPAQEPAVTCEFSAQGRRYEVTRSPAWDKPSARGKNGFTTQQAKTLLRERVDGTWTEKSARNDEAGAEILALLGMDREQFTRVVMLPQGDFAAFLRSKATDRLELLQKLFGTERFEAVELELSRQAQAAKEEVSVLAGQLELLAVRAEAEADPLELDGAGAPPVEDTAARLTWLENAVGLRRQELAGRAEEAEAGSNGCRNAVEAEAAREDRRRKLDSAEARKAAAEQAAPLLEGQLLRLSRHRKAEVLDAQLRALDSADAKVRSAANAAESAVTLLRLAAGEDAELSRLDLDFSADFAAAGTAQPVAGADAELGRLRSLLAVVEARLPDEDRLLALRKRHSVLAKKREELAAVLARDGSRTEELQAERTRISGGLQELEQRSAAVALRRKEAAAAQELLDVVKRYASAVSARNLVKVRHDESREQQLEAKRRWLDLREQRLANAAAELAAGLVQGEQCPVCGSHDHPDPAAGGHGGPALAQEEEDARLVHEAAEAAFNRVAAEWGNASQLVAVLAGQGGDTPEAAALDAAESAGRAAADAEAAEAELRLSRLRLDELAAALAAVQEARTGTEGELARTAASLEDVSEQAAALDVSLAELRGGHRSLPKRLRALEDAVAVLAKAVEAHGHLGRMQAQHAEAREELELALPAAGFSTAVEAREQLLDGAAAEALESGIRAAQDEEAKVAELFVSADILQALEEKTAGYEPDGERLGALREVAAAAAREARDADLAAGMAARCLASLQSIRAEYDELAGSAQQPAERARMLAGLADAAAGRGENAYRMSLNSYVLAARLEQVALAASERLVAMSDGRYLLQHTDARAARGAKSGLGLEVVDQWTGFRRDTSTLSGGESFMASLSLALGLADVVQQEAGGVEIETLFVDEGFGSLDEQSLEQVMDALEGLRDGGRVVGLVSHVAEMKQRIGAQLQVMKGRNGSTLRISDSLDAPA